MTLVGPLDAEKIGKAFLLDVSTIAFPASLLYIFSMGFFKVSKNMQGYAANVKTIQNYSFIQKNANICKTMQWYEHVSHKNIIILCLCHWWRSEVYVYNGLVKRSVTKG